MSTDLAPTEDAAPVQSIDEAIAELIRKYPDAQLRIERSEDEEWSASLWAVHYSTHLAERDGDGQFLELLGQVDHDDLAEAFARLNDGMDGEPT